MIQQRLKKSIVGALASIGLVACGGDGGDTRNVTTPVLVRVTNLGVFKNIQSISGTTAIDLTWDEEVTQDGLEVELYKKESTDSDNAYKREVVKSAGIKTHALVGLQQDRDYTLKFRFIKGTTEVSEYSSPVEVKTLAADGQALPPNAPHHLSLSYANQSVLVTWSYTGPAVDSFSVSKRLATDSASQAAVVEKTKTSYTDNQTLGLLLPNKTYAYRVSAKNAVGEIFSEEATIVIPNGPISPVIGVVASDDLLKQIKITWQKSPDSRVTGYELEKSMDNVSFAVLTSALNQDTITYSDQTSFTTITSSTQAYYRVRAVGVDNNQTTLRSEPSSVATGLARVATTNKLAKPTGFTVQNGQLPPGTPASPGSPVREFAITINWTANPATMAGSYDGNIIEYSTNQSTGYVAAFVTGNKVVLTNIGAGGIPVGTTIYFRAKAKSKNWVEYIDSDYTPVVSASAN